MNGLFVDYDSFDDLGVTDCAAMLFLDLDIVDVNDLSSILFFGNGRDRLDCHISQILFRTANALTCHCCHCDALEHLCVPGFYLD